MCAGVDSSSGTSVASTPLSRARITGKRGMMKDPKTTVDAEFHGIGLFLDNGVDI